MSESNDKKFLKGAAILAFAGIMIKFIGAVFRIPLTNWIGDGMAYYSVAYAIYSTLVVLGIAGVPVAISRLVSESIAKGQYRNAHRIFHMAGLLLFGVGVFSFSICFFGADLIAKGVGSPDSAVAVRAMAPALFFVPLFSSFRGFFNGRQNMNPTAISEITEQLVRCGVGLYLAYFFAVKGDDIIKAAAGASFGASAGAFAGLFIIAIIFLLNKKTFNKKIMRGDQTLEPRGAVIKKIALIAIPIIIGSEIMPIMTLIDTSLVMNILQATGWSQKVTEHLYSLYGGYVNPLIAFPQIFTQAVAISLVPAISKHFAVNNVQGVKDTVKLGYRTTMIMGLPCGIGIFVLAEPILKTLYFEQPKSCHEAAPIMMIMALGVILLSHMQTSTSVLQSIGKQTVPVKNLAIGCIGKVVITSATVGIHVINVKGAAIGTLFAYAIAAILNDRAVKKYTGVSHNISTAYIRPAVAAVVMGVWAFFVQKGLNLLLQGIGENKANALSVAIAVLTAMVVYAVMIFIVKAISLEELKFFPGGNKIERVARKFIKE